MIRQSISFTEPNADWLKSQVDSQEFASKSEVVNDLIRRARREQQDTNWIRATLARAEKSGFTDETREMILSQSKEQLRTNGEL